MLSRMTGAQRVELMAQMCDDVREVARCGIRARHPSYSADDVEHALHRVILGDELADKVWPSFTHLRP